MERRLSERRCAARGRRPRSALRAFAFCAAVLAPSCIQGREQRDAAPAEAQARTGPEPKRKVLGQRPRPEHRGEKERLPDFDIEAPLPEIAKALFTKESITCVKGGHHPNPKIRQYLDYFDHRSESLGHPGKGLKYLWTEEPTAAYGRIMAETDRGQLLGMLAYLDSIGTMGSSKMGIRESMARQYLRLENPFKSTHFRIECMDRAGIAFRMETLGITRLIDISLEEGGLDDAAGTMTLLQQRVFYDRMVIRLFRWSRDFDPRLSDAGVQQLGREHKEIMLHHLFDFLMEDFGLHRTYRSCAWEVRRVTRDGQTREGIFNAIREIERLDAMRD